MEEQKTVYIPFIDGTEVLIPIQCIKKDNGEYVIQDNDEFNFTDESIIFKFGPKDKIKIKWENSKSFFVVDELVNSGDPRNEIKRFFYDLLKSKKVDVLDFSQTIKEFIKHYDYQKNPIRKSKNGLFNIIWIKYSK